MTAILQTKNVTKRFGGILANDDISLEIYSTEITGFIGPNGAGKTTFFDMLCGVKPTAHKPGPDSGTISFDGTDTTHLRADQICRLGIGRAFQITRVFGELSVIDNVAVGALTQSDSLVEAEERAREVIEFVGLGDRASVIAEHLTLPERKKLEVSRALATDPQMLMLDEVMAGLTSTEVNKEIEVIQRIAARGITVVLVEHVLPAVMALCDRVVVLDKGRVIADGSPAHVVEDEAVADAYLGRDHRD